MTRNPSKNVQTKKVNYVFIRHRRRLFILMSFFYEKVLYCYMAIGHKPPHILYNLTNNHFVLIQILNFLTHRKMAHDKHIF